MKKCPYCDRPNDDQAEVCVHCKAVIPNENKETEKKDEEFNRFSRKR